MYYTFYFNCCYCFCCYRKYIPTEINFKETCISFNWYNNNNNKAFGSKDDNKSVYSTQSSFTPTITKRARSVDRGLTSRDSSCDRLYSQSKLLKEKQEKLKQESTRKELEKCTFAPKINNNNNNKPSGPSGVRSANSSPASSRGRTTTTKATNQGINNNNNNNC